MEKRKAAGGLTAPLSIYEMHLGSWRHIPAELEISHVPGTGPDARRLSYRNGIYPR